MQGKICIVTGANSGIGKATAMGLAKMGAVVVMACRDRDRGEAALREIKSGSGSDSVELMLVDLASQESIRQFAADYKRAHDQLHVLVNNAAVNRWTFSKTVDGLETNFAVNHFGPFLLTNLLLDVLKASAPARIINLTSSAQSAIDFDDLMGEAHFDRWQAYSRSKMANVLFTYELARRLSGSGVTANCAHPGVVRTNLGRDVGPVFKIFVAVMKPFMKSPEKGAQTPIYLASSPEVEGVSGKYFVNKKEAVSSAQSYDEAAARRLWQISEELTGIKATA
jgi:NAD(P)-dependent dehydrogenase (short-subunit alcohol dehydrogenase family)